MFLLTTILLFDFLASTSNYYFSDSETDPYSTDEDGDYNPDELITCSVTSVASTSVDRPDISIISQDDGT